MAVGVGVVWVVTKDYKVLLRKKKKTHVGRSSAVNPPTRTFDSVSRFGSDAASTRTTPPARGGLASVGRC